MRAIRLGVLIPAACAVCLLSAGCIRQATPPTLTVTGARVIDRTAEVAIVEFDLEADNTNDIALPLRELRYEFAVDGDTVFTGSRSPEATIRRFGSQAITVPVVVPLAELEGATLDDAGGVPYRLKGRVTYIIPGALAELLFDTNVRRPTVGFEDRGSLDLAG